MIDTALYPKDHPYNCQVIGSLKDLQNATLGDAKTQLPRLKELGFGEPILLNK